MVSYFNDTRKDGQRRRGGGEGEEPGRKKGEGEGKKQEGGGRDPLFRVAMCARCIYALGFRPKGQCTSEIRLCRGVGSLLGENTRRGN